jgi:hypothetical protein
MIPTTLALSAPVRLLALSHAGTRLVAVHETQFTVVDLATRRAVAQGPVSGVVYAAAFTPDDGALLLGTRAPTLVDLTSLKVAPPAFKGPASAANAIGFAPDGATAYLANGSFMASSDCYLYAFDLATRAQRWRSKPTANDGLMDVCALGDRVVLFGEQGAVVVVEPARGASLGRIQLVARAPYGASMVLGASLGGTGVVAVTLDEGTPVVARIDVASTPTVTWHTELDLPDADEDESSYVGRPMVAGDAVHVPVQWSAEGRARTTLFSLDAAGGALRGQRDLDGCTNYRAIACAGDTLCWAAGANELRFDAIG